MPITSDSIQRQIVLGQFQPPKAGDIVKRPDGPNRTWTAIDAVDGAFQNRALHGGYLYLSYHSDSARTLILDASGHNLVYVNGVPRVGDPYSTGYVQLPIPVIQGDNHFLFQIGRGSLHARLRTPRASATIEPADATVPDLVVGTPSQALASVLVVNASENPLEHAVLSAELPGGEDRVLQGIFGGIHDQDGGERLRGGPDDEVGEGGVGGFDDGGGGGGSSDGR